MSAGSNFHTHSLYCDGKDTLEELARQALKLGFTALGFSGHSFTFFDQSYCMSEENTLKYQKEVNELKERYRGKLKICLGIEQDLYSAASTAEYDYVIGSVHYVKKGDNYLSIDESAEDLQSYAAEYYDGDIYSLIEDYYQAVGELAQKECQIIGHFDLITKFQEKTPLFAEEHPRYQKAARASLGELLKAGKIIEINTGAMARDWRSMPYPAKQWLDIIARSNGRMLLSSDCHDKNCLDYGFREPLVRLYAPFILNYRKKQQ